MARCIAGVPGYAYLEWPQHPRASAHSFHSLHMGRAIRFGAWVQGTGWRQRTLSCNSLPLAVRFDAAPAFPARLPAAGLMQRLRLEARVLLLLAAFLVLFQALILREPVALAPGIVVGVVALIAGLVLFVEGLRAGLVPLAHGFGEHTVSRAVPPALLAIVLLFGV